MKNVLQFLIISTLLMFFVSCENMVENNLVNAKTVKSFEGVSGQTVCGEQTWTLWAGDNVDAGTLTVANDSDYLYVTYKTSGAFGNLNLWIGKDLSLLPKDKKGNLLLNKFPYDFAASGLNEFTFEIPLQEISNYKPEMGSLFVVANAEVSLDGNDEVGFGGEFEASAADKNYHYSKYVVR
jgi:hypothetical protein